MGLNFDNPHVEVGDRGFVFSDWRFVGVQTDRNTDRGRLYVNLNGATLELHKSRGLGDLVASGPDASDADVVLSPANGSGLTATVYRSAGAVGDGVAGPIVTVFVYLCDEQDLRAREQHVDGLLIEGERDFNNVLTQTMREFFTRFAGIFPPPPGAGHPLRWSPSIVEQGSRGEPEYTSQFFWGLNRRGAWEIVGLQNPDDYREWAIQQTLSFAYDRTARGGSSDPVFERAMAKQAMADRLFERIKPWVDVDHDRTPDRQPKVRSLRIRRG